MRTFQATTKSIEVVDACAEELAQAWASYREARASYAKAQDTVRTLARRPWSEQGHREYADSESSARDSRAAYFRAIERLKSAHREYKTAFRNLLQNKQL